MSPADVQGKHVTVVGGARSGLAAARLLAGAGADVFLTEHGAATSGLEEALGEAGVAYEFGGHTRRALEADFFVVSPGVPSSAPVVRQAQRNGLAVYSEIEAAFWFCEAPVVAITGTNGKTTTTSLAGHLFRQALGGSGREVIVAGNIGYPFSDYVEDAGPEDIVVMEVSSFQLDHIDTFRPRVAALLNVTPDHLDRYDNNFNDYAQSKFRLFENQRGDEDPPDTLVYNGDDDLVRGFVEKVAGRRGLQALAFSTRREVERGAFIDDEGRIIFRIHGQEEPLMLADERAPSLRGQHNLQNTLAAAISARIMEVRSSSLRESLTSFEGVPHRLELVRTTGAPSPGGDGSAGSGGEGGSGGENGRAGVRWVNDSKATNVNAVWYALESFEGPLVLIAGGRDKGNDYATLKPLVRQKVRAVIALGESADKVMRELGAAAPECRKVASMEEATRAAAALVQSGDVVLLSPACSSFDMYENYEERGDTFRRLVMNL